jgi:hypothetical protein
MAGQLALDDRWTDRGTRTVKVGAADEKGRAAAERGRAASTTVLCAACQAREARYGFRGEGDDPQADRPRTLCFECFRVEIGRRQEAAQAVQGRLPLELTLDALSRRRRRAQIAARRALAVSGF